MIHLQDHPISFKINNTATQAQIGVGFLIEQIEKHESYNQYQTDEHGRTSNEKKKKINEQQHDNICHHLLPIQRWYLQLKSSRKNRKQEAGKFPISEAASILNRVLTEKKDNQEPIP